MDTNSGKIYRAENADQLAKIEQELENALVPLTPSQERTLTPMNAAARKGWMRNQPCVCGSGKKFKKCCWHKYSGKAD